MNLTTNPSLFSCDIAKFCYLSFSTVVNRVTLFIGYFLNHINLIFFFIIERGLNLGTPTKGKRREHAYDQCSMVLCHSKGQAILTLIMSSSIQNTEESLTRPLSPLVWWRAIVEKHAVLVILRGNQN